MQTFFLKYFNKPKEKKITVIHCDDHSLFRYGVRNALANRKDIEIIGEAGNGLELLKLLETNLPDVVILNITMPVMDGIQTLHEIKKRYSDLKVIILSMHDCKDMVVKLMELGANSYLTKNSDSETICKAIKCVLEYEYYYSDAIAAALVGPDKMIKKNHYEFSSKELQLFSLLKANKSEKEIAGIMALGERTIFAIIDKLKMKTGAKTKSQLLGYDINKRL